ncbi:MAG: flagellin [Acidobacteria bacterium]|nr:flagellin [Acidobacteriota bacterium]
MGIRINQNVMAMNAYRNLTSSEGALSKSLERLSSGFRINRAADDAAGLVISEGLRSQVMGLKMATRNAQDGVSVVQTAEGALTETHSILQRIRELAVQAASTGSSDQPSRDAAQVEVVQLKSELDRIANTTKFGAQTLLNGGYGVTNSTTAGTAGAALVDIGTTFKFSIDVDNAGLQTAVDVTLTGTGLVTQYTADDTVAATATKLSGSAAAKALETDINKALQTALVPAYGAGSVPFTAKVTISGTGAAARFVTTFSSSNPTQTFKIDKDALGVGTAADVAAALGVVAHVSTVSGSGGTFQVGSGTSASDQISITIGDMRSASLGLSAVDVSSASASTTNITAIDAAITTVSTLRGNLGAYQNRFEHTISNLSITTENLSASESRIRDTDMAAEMMSFTRAQILQQAGTAMLAQANAVPQTVLQLLK